MATHRLARLAFVTTLAVAFAACGDDPTTPHVPTDTDEAQLLLQHLEATRNYDVQGNFVVGAAAVRTTLLSSPTKQHIIDLRTAADFAKGHIPGAVQVDMANLLTHVKALSPAAPTYERIVLVCYSGQSSAYAVAILRALGYSNAISMKWGMSAWHQDLATPWLNNRSNARATQFIGGASPPMHNAVALPKLTTGKKVASEILEVRAAALLTAGYTPATVNHTTLFQNLDGHYIVNFWPANLYQSPGHIPGAVLYDPATKPFESGTHLKTLPTDKPTVLYCYTGQTSSYLAGFLRLLGYDVKSLLYGGNGMIYDVMVAGNVANTFIPATEIMNYDYAK
jgi:rhodanese-related sulfurtransferase